MKDKQEITVLVSNSVFINAGFNSCDSFWFQVEDVSWSVVERSVLIWDKTFCMKTETPERLKRVTANIKFELT